MNGGLERCPARGRRRCLNRSRLRLFMTGYGPWTTYQRENVMSRKFLTVFREVVARCSVNNRVAKIFSVQD